MDADFRHHMAIGKVVAELVSVPALTMTLSDCRQCLVTDINGKHQSRSELAQFFRYITNILSRRLCQL